MERRRFKWQRLAVMFAAGGSIALASCEHKLATAPTESRPSADQVRGALTECLVNSGTFNSTMCQVTGTISPFYGGSFYWPGSYEWTSSPVGSNGIVPPTKLMVINFDKPLYSVQVVAMDADVGAPTMVAFECCGQSTRLRRLRLRPDISSRRNERANHRRRSGSHSQGRAATGHECAGRDFLARPHLRRSHTATPAFRKPDPCPELRTAKGRAACFFQRHVEPAHAGRREAVVLAGRSKLSPNSWGGDNVCRQLRNGNDVFISALRNGLAVGGRSKRNDQWTAGSERQHLFLRVGSAMPFRYNVRHAPQQSDVPKDAG